MPVTSRYAFISIDTIPTIDFEHIGIFIFTTARPRVLFSVFVDFR